MARRQKKRTSSVTEAGGFKLILSKRNATCYYGVAEVSNRFKASLSRQGQNVYLGKFGTKVEAAIAVSRFLQKETEGKERNNIKPTWTSQLARSRTPSAREKPQCT